MMKEFDEKRSIDVKVSRTVCDICGEATKEGDAIIRVQVRREEPRDSSRGPYLSSFGYSHGLDICSVDCLAKNIKGVGLILQTKEIPAIPNSTASNQWQGQVLTATSLGTAGWTTPSTITVGNLTV